MVSTRIDWVREHCRLRRGIADEFRRTRPFDGLAIGTGIHLEAKTVALLLTLRDGGARLISTGKILIIENLCGLASLPPVGFRFSATALEQSSQGPLPVRAFAEIG